MFTHLHVHTGFSILDGASKIPELVQKAKELGMTHLSITDHGSMYGCIAFYKECKNNGIIPILGCEVYVAPGSRLNKTSIKGEKNYYHLILLAENNTGYKNLVKIVSQGFVDGFYYKPRVDYETLEKYHEGIICLSGCVSGEVAYHCSNGNIDKAKKAIITYQSIFGDKNYFLEIQKHDLPGERKAYDGVISLAKEMNVPLVCTNDVHYVKKEDAIVQRVLNCIMEDKILEGPNPMGDTLYLKSEEEMKMLYPNIPEAISNTQLIANRCNVELEFKNTKLPKYELPKNTNPEEYLKNLCLEGLKQRYANYEEHLERMNYELKVIFDMGFTEYFLIVWDFINWARTHDVAVGPGRGSCCGSIVSYALGISDIDPIKYELLFERFLNPERVSMPDIDTDFEYEKREKVIDYVKEKYGKNNVVQITAIQTLAARQAIKAVGKVLSIPFSKTNEITKHIPEEPGMTIKKALEISIEFQKVYANYKELVDLAMGVEGLPKSVSTHAAGVVICPSSASDYIPLALNADKTNLASQYNMIEIEELGLLKMDFLGLRTLTVIKDAFKNIGRTFEIPLNDEDTFKFISTGKTVGVFQLESGGMQDFMKKLKPTCIEDLIAGVALYRPGPMDFIPMYIKGKRNPLKVTYECNELKPILEKTYGCIIYQEQVMQIFQNLAGYSLGQADNIRRAMSKKKQKIIDDERNSFVYGDKDRNIAGCVNNGISEKAANKIYDSMVDFAKYAFNKSHAAAYAIIAYQTAYLKTHYKKEFMSAVMTSVVDDSEKLAIYMNAVAKEKIKLIPPDINVSTEKFVPVKKGIVFPLNGIKGIGTNFTKTIVKERETSPFIDLPDFITRMSDVNIEQARNLCLAGTFDFTNHNRQQQVLFCEKFLDNIKKEKKKNIEGQLDIFSFIDEEPVYEYPDAEEYLPNILLDKEREVCGAYLSGHPLDEYRGLIEKYATDNIIDIETSKDNVTLCGYILERRETYTKKGTKMAFLVIEDLSGIINAIAFPNIYTNYYQYFGKGMKVIVRGKVEVEDEKTNLLISSILPFDCVPRKCWINFDNYNDYCNGFETMVKIGQKYKGKDACIVFLKDSKQIQILNGFINCGVPAIKELQSIFGKKNVKVTYS